MSDQQIPIHYVATHDEALELIRKHDRVWVSNCGCRERHGKCERSRMDVCLMFGEDTEGSGSGKKEIRLAEVVGILNEAKAKHLVARPFRNETRTETEGVCFCCDDCCAYFLDPREKCDQGKMIENTDFESCDQCDICIDVCHFGARKISDGVMAVDQDKCYGCGLCADVCPPKCVEMVKR
jgi:Pyruvate/2-oxoacid:ferredoxin oxidoreductase delta subunit